MNEDREREREREREISLFNLPFYLFFVVVIAVSGVGQALRRLSHAALSSVSSVGEGLAYNLHGINPDPLLPLEDADDETASGGVQESEDSAIGTDADGWSGGGAEMRVSRADRDNDDDDILAPLRTLGLGVLSGVAGLVETPVEAYRHVRRVG